MARIFRALLIAAVNAIQEFFAFATDNGESQVGDSVKLNDGMATSNYDWSAYPSDTEITGTYTQTGTIEKVKQIGDEFVYGMQEPEQDNKDVSINSGEMYYAYTNANDESVYTTDNPIKERKFNLENAMIVGTSSLTETNGIYSGFSDNNYISVTNSLPILTTKGKMIFKITYTSGAITQYILSATNENKCLLIYNGQLQYWDGSSGIYQGTTFQNNNTYWIGIDMTSNSLTAYTILDNNNIYTKETLPDFSSIWNQEFTFNSNVFQNISVKFATGSVSGGYWRGKLDLANTYFNYDDIETTFGSFSDPSTLYDNTFTALNPQPEFEVGTGIIASDLQNGAIVIPVKEIHNSMEMVIHFKTGSSWPNLCLCDSSKDGTERNPSVYFQNYNAVLVAWLYSSSYTSGDADIANNYYVGFNLDLNKEYWFKTTWDGTAYKFYVSTNGDNYTIGDTLNSTVPINWVNNYLYLGNNYDTSTSDVYQNIYLNGTYIKVDGETIFNGSTAIENIDFTNTGCTLTGFALNTIKIGNNLYRLNDSKDEVKDIPGLTFNTVDNTTINSVTVSTPTQGYVDIPYYAYTNGSNQSVYTVDNPIKNGDTWTQPALSSDGTMGGDICAVETNITLYSGVSAYYGFDGDNSNTFHSASGSTVGYFTFYTPTPIKVTSIQFRNQGGYNGRASRGGTIYGSNDNSNWTTITTFVHTDTSNQIWSIDLSSNNGFYKYYKVYSDGTISASYWVFEECTFTAVTNQNPSVLYDNSFEPIDPQPSFSYEKAGLKNGRVVGTLNKNDGVYSDFGSARNYIISNNKFNFLADTWEIVTKVKFNSIKKTLFMGSGYVNAETDYSISLGIDASGHICAYLTSSPSTWNIAIATPSTRVVEANIFYYIKLYFTGTAYKVDVSTTGEFDGEDNYLDIPSTTKVYNADNCILWGINAYGFVPSENLDGELDMKGTYFNCDGVRTDFYNEVSDIIITSETPNVTYYRNLTNDLEQTVSVDTTIQTSANVTTSNNDIAITDGSYHLFNLTVPTSMTPVIESSGISYQTNEMPLLLKSNTGVGFLLKNDNNAYYRNSWVMNKSYDLHYQQINFSYPSGATVTCKVNNVTTDLTPYCYPGDVITWSCDNAGVVTTGTYTVKYNSVDGNIQTITIS